MLSLVPVVMGLVLVWGSGGLFLAPLEVVQVLLTPLEVLQVPVRGVMYF
jgi:hypothetical protein